MTSATNIQRFLNTILDVKAVRDDLLNLHEDNAAFIDILDDMRRDPNVHIFSPQALFDQQQAHNADIKAYIPGEDAEQTAVLADIENIFTEMKAMTCTICKLPGHRTANCWLNGQVYASARSSGRQDSNFQWRDAIKLKNDIDQDAIRAALQARRTVERANARHLKANSRIKPTAAAIKKRTLAVGRVLRVQGAAAKVTWAK